MTSKKTQLIEKNESLSNQKSDVCEKAEQRTDWRDFQDTEENSQKFYFPTFTELKNVIAFLLLNIVAVLLVDIYPEPSAELRSMLGMAPPLLWVNLACSIYLFTELILVFCRERTKNTDRFALKQLFFLSTMYVFYWYAGALQQHFALLLGIGVSLQLFESFARKSRKPPAPVE